MVASEDVLNARELDAPEVQLDHMRDHGPQAALVANASLVASAMEVTGKNIRYPPMGKV